MYKVATKIPADERWRHHPKISSGLEDSEAYPAAVPLQIKLIGITDRQGEGALDPIGCRTSWKSHTPLSTTIPGSDGLLSRRMDSAVETSPLNGQEDAQMETGEDDDLSVENIEEILLTPRHINGASISRCSTSMEGSMPGLASFCNGSFPSISSEGFLNASAVFQESGSVSNLDDGPWILPIVSNHDTAMLSFPSNRIEEETKDILQPLVAQVSPEKKNHQQVRWSGSAHRSSDTLPLYFRNYRQAGQDNEDF